MQRQQQQQFADFDLLAVFNDESKAEAAEAKLHKEGFGDDEVFRLAPGTVGSGQFREHGPNRDRSAVFLQTTRSGPNPMIVVLLAVLFGLILGVVMFLAHFAFVALPEPVTAFVGAVVGIVIGAIIGLLQRGSVRGAIGQDMSRANAPSSTRAVTEGQMAVAVRFSDAENISRKSRARAILINNGGKIDRSVGRGD
jgi:hypothetical protein